MSTVTVNVGNIDSKLFTVADSAARLALTNIVKGDYVRQEDTSIVYVLVGDPATISGWELVGSQDRCIYYGGTVSTEGTVWGAIFEGDDGSLYFDGTSVYVDKPQNLTGLRTSWGGNNVNLDGILDVSGLQNLTYLNCAVNSLTSLNVSGCTNLSTLICNNNQLTSLTGLSDVICDALYCQNNNLTTLDLSGSQGTFTYFDCSNNGMTSLNVTGCTNMYDLEFYDNQLLTVDITGCISLNYVYGVNNIFTSTTVDNFLIALDNTVTVLSFNLVDLSDQTPAAPRTAASNTAYNSLTNIKGWTVTLDP